MTDKLHVSAINSVGNYLLPPVFRHFAGKYPNIRLVVQDMEAEMACASIIRGRTDIAFSTAKVETDQIIATSFLTEPMTILHASGLSLPDEVSLEQLPLADEIHIRWSAEHAYWYHAAFPDPCPRIELELMGQIALFVSRYQGWTIVPKSVADSLCDHSDLQQSKPVFHMPVRTIYILRHRDYAETAIIHCFLDVLREVLQEPYGDNFLL